MRYRYTDPSGCCIVCLFVVIFWLPFLETGLWVTYIIADSLSFKTFGICIFLYVASCKISITLLEPFVQLCPKNWGTRINLLANFVVCLMNSYTNLDDHFVSWIVAFINTLGWWGPQSTASHAWNPRCSCLDVHALGHVLGCSCKLQILLSKNMTLWNKGSRGGCK